MLEDPVKFLLRGDQLVFVPVSFNGVDDRAAEERRRELGGDEIIGGPGVLDLEREGLVIHLAEHEEGDGRVEELQQRDVLEAGAIGNREVNEDNVGAQFQQAARAFGEAGGLGHVERGRLRLAQHGPQVANEIRIVLDEENLIDGRVHVLRRNHQ